MTKSLYHCLCTTETNLSRRIQNAVWRELVFPLVWWWKMLELPAVKQVPALELLFPSHKTCSCQDTRKTSVAKQWMGKTIPQFLHPWNRSEVHSILFLQVPCSVSKGDDLLLAAGYMSQILLGPCRLHRWRVISSHPFDVAGTLIWDWNVMVTPHLEAITALVPQGYLPEAP